MTHNTVWLPALFLVLSCAGEHDEGHEHANDHMHQYSVEELSREFESEERQQWQKPEEVIALLGNIENKTVIDIGAGTGYFTFRLAARGAHVIAADVDDRFQDFIRQKMKESTFSGFDIELRKVPYDSPGLQPGEADFAVIVNTYHHIDNRVDYLEKLLSGLKSGGRLLIVDFQKKEFEDEPHGPPFAMRLEYQQVLKEMREAGFIEIRLNDTLLPYQYIILGNRQAE
jgi:SAM-dependent methyltransferase